MSARLPPPARASAPDFDLRSNAQPQSLAELAAQLEPQLHGAWAMPGAALHWRQGDTAPRERGPGFELLLHRSARGEAWLSAPKPWAAEAEDALVPALEGSCSLLLELEALRGEARKNDDALKLQRALFAISEIASSQRSAAEVLSGLHRIVGELMYAENFFIARWSPARRTLRFAYYADTEDADGVELNVELPAAELPGSLTLAVIRKRRPLRGPSERIAREQGLREHPEGPDSVDWLGVPLLLDGEAVGAVVVQSYRQEHRYGADDEALLGYVADHITAALQRREGTRELEERVAERTTALEAEIRERQRAEQLQSALYRITALASRFNPEDDEQKFYAEAHAIVGEMLDASNFYIALYDERIDELSFPYSIDEKQPVRENRRAGRGMTEYVLHHGEPLLATTSTLEGLEAAGSVVRRDARSLWWLGVPMRVSDQPVGVIAVQSYRQDVLYTYADLELLGFVAAHIATAIARRRADRALRQAYLDLERRVADRTREVGLANESLRQQIGAREGIERQLKHQALHDSLTGLPNRQYLLDRMISALARDAGGERAYAVLFLDLDRFKVINDSEGHLVGDGLLREVALRIGQCVRSPDVLARLGGDEFAILLEQIHGVDDAIQVAQRIMAALASPFLIDGRELHTSASIGIALAQPSYVSAEEVLRDADAAMYRAKAEGKNRFALFDEDLRHFAQQRLELEQELRRGLVHDEFLPVYQPIISLGSGAILGYEALLRWRREEGVWRAPGRFLALAEETGLIEEIDWRIYAQALRDIAALTPTHAYVSMNLSPRHLLVPDFASRFLQLVEAKGAKPSRVCVEVTEGALIDRKDLARATLEALNAAGVRILLDDFGTGYSALSYLQHFPLHGLKIDRSFAAALDGDGNVTGSRPIIRAIVAMAASLDLDVVSEGIETEEQRSALWTLGVRQGQGYHFGRPAPLEHWTGEPPVKA